MEEPVKKIEIVVQIDGKPVTLWSDPAEWLRVWNFHEDLKKQRRKEGFVV